MAAFFVVNVYENFCHRDVFVAVRLHYLSAGGNVGRQHLTRRRSDNTCNKWTAKGLESAGVNINPSLKLTSGSVMGFLKVAN